MGEVVVITSGKGGVGKSAVTANLAVALNRAGKRVVMVDADTGLRCLDILLGLEDRVVYDLSDVADGVCRLKQAIIKDRVREGLALIAAAQTRDGGAVTPAQMRKISLKLKRDYDFVLIDCPAGTGAGFRAAVAAADSAILVVAQDAVALRAAERVKRLISDAGVDDIRLVANRASSPDEAQRAASALELPLAGVIPESARIARMASGGRPAAGRYSPSGLAFKRLAATMLPAAGKASREPAAARQ